jgi:Holliday junction DNA helicase RuvA
MIASLRGIVQATGEDGTIIDVAGVGYLVFASARSRDSFVVGETVSVLVETQVREDAITLFGFRDRPERDCFRLLTTVQGVGARVALSLLSALAPNDLLTAIAVGDRAALTQAAGVGPKLATRILSELKEKAGGIALAPVTAGPAAGGGKAAAASEAMSALVNLGYSATDAWRAVSEASDTEGPSAKVEALIRSALKTLAPKERAR